MTHTFGGTDSDAMSELVYLCAMASDLLLLRVDTFGTNLDVSSKLEYLRAMASMTVPTSELLLLGVASLGRVKRFFLRGGGGGARFFFFFGSFPLVSACLVKTETVFINTIYVLEVRQLIVPQRKTTVVRKTPVVQ